MTGPKGQNQEFFLYNFLKVFDFDKLLLLS